MLPSKHMEAQPYQTPNPRGRDKDVKEAARREGKMNEFEKQHDQVFREP